MMVDKFMEEAIQLSLQGMRNGKGGPFGAVVVRGDEIIGAGHNEVLLTNDPTAHAEVVAIRRASQRLGRFDLSGSVLYTSCEPCPMCLAAAYWAYVDKIYYANTREDAAGIGFQDESLYMELGKSLNDGSRRTPLIQLMRADAIKAFEEWKKRDGTKLY